MTASTQSGIRRSDTSAMSRLAFSSCTHRMNQTELMVNQPKTCGTMRLVGESANVAGVGLSGSLFEFVCVACAHRYQLAVRCDRTWMYTWLLGTSGVFLMS